jgi:Virulence factor BrkB
MAEPQIADELTERRERSPDPDDLTKPDSPTDLTKESWRFVLRRTAREFGSDQCTDLAAALTYYAVLSLFPALMVVISLLGVFGQGRRTTDACCRRQPRSRPRRRSICCASRFSRSSRTRLPGSRRPGPQCRGRALVRVRVCRRLR